MGTTAENLSRHRDIFTEAFNKRWIPRDVYDFLKESWSYSLICGIAGNPSLLPEALSRLAGDTDSGVRSNVAGNPSCPPGVLLCLIASVLRVRAR